MPAIADRARRAGRRRRELSTIWPFL